MPEIGFIDDKGARVTFADALAGKGEFAIRRPMLAAMVATQIKTRYCDASITELLPAGMQRQRILRARHDYWVKPDDTIRLVWGSAMHALLERHAQPGVATEQRLTVNLDGLKVGGTPDTAQLWQPGTFRKGWTLEIVDWKTTNVANVRHILSDGPAKLAEGAGQLNAYWVLANISPDSPILKAGLDPAKVEPVLVLEHLCRDHRDYEAARPGKTAYPRWHEPFEVPAAPVAETLATIRAAVRAWKKSQKLADDDLPKCDPALLYGGRKCRDYCEAAPFCRYAAANIEKLSGARNY
jgi:hypothetical protein